MARKRTELLLEVLEGRGFARPNPNPMFPKPSGLLRLEPHSEGLRERIWWGAAFDATAAWAARLGMNLMSSTLKDDEGGAPFHVQQAEQIRAFRRAEPEVLVEQLAGDEAIAEADTLLLTIPSQLGVEYNAHLLESILSQVAPALGWR